MPTRRCGPSRNGYAARMPFPQWLARVNRRYTNRALIRLADRPPFAALTHVGRNSGKEYRIPLNALPTEDGFVIALTYGPGADWVKNVLAASQAKLEYGGRTFDLGDPRVVGRDEADRYFSLAQRAALRVLRVTEYLRLYR